MKLIIKTTISINKYTSKESTRLSLKISFDLNIFSSNSSHMLHVMNSISTQTKIIDCYSNTLINT